MTATSTRPGIDHPGIVSPVNTSALKQWVPASKLKKGEHLKTPGGATAVADGGTTPKHHDGWMWDLTVPGNDDHDFYVLSVARSTSGSDTSRTHYAGATSVPVLAHNSGGLCGSEALEQGDWQHIVDRHLPGGALVDDESSIFTGDQELIRQRIINTIDRGTPMRNTPDPVTGQPRPGKVYEWDFGTTVGRAGSANGGDDLTRIRVVVNDGKVVTAFPF